MEPTKESIYIELLSGCMNLLKELENKVGIISVARTPETPRCEEKNGPKTPLENAIIQVLEKISEIKANIKI
jgi:hypothetical protein